MPSSGHHWVSPQELAERLGGDKAGHGWRAPCPGHASENPTTLSIREGTDRHGNPVTLLKCFVGCDMETILGALGLQLSDLFCVRTPYASPGLPARPTPRTERLRTMQTPSGDDIALIMLEEMIVSDPHFLEECPPARDKMWELGQDPAKRQRLNVALREARHDPARMWSMLRAEQGGMHGGS